MNFELDSYLDALSDFPSSSTTLDTEKGRAFCIKIDVFKKKMWFAYVDSSIAWYDFDTSLVKKLISQNKRGEKTPPLEDLKQPETNLVSIDLIQENNVDRFEKKNRSKSNKPRFDKNNPNRKPAGNNDGQRPSNNGNRQNQGQNQNQNQNGSPRNHKNSSNNKPREEKVVNKVESQGNAEAPKKKKFKKHYPKKDNNA